MSVLLVMIASVLLYGVPGVLFYFTLRERGYGRIASMGVGLALLTVLYATLASLVGYVFWLQVGATLLLDAVLLWAGYRRVRAGRVRWQDWWPRLARWEWLLITLIAVVYLAPAYLINVPFDTDAQGFGLLIVTVKRSGSITTLAPFRPEVKWFYSPGYFLLGAQLADLTGAAADDVMLGLSHLLALGVIASVGALGERMGGRANGWWAAVAAAGGVALFTTLMDSAYTNVYGLWLTATFLWVLVHALERGAWVNVALAGLALAGIVLGHPDSLIHLLLAYVPFFLTVWLARPRLSRAQYLRLAVVVPLLGVLLCLPWLARTWPLIGQIDVHERQNPNMSFLNWLFEINGRWVPVLAVVGLWWALRRRHWLDVWSVTWLAPIVEISSLGNLDALSRGSALDPMQIFYPYGVAWHAAIIPLPLLAARALTPLGAWLARLMNAARVRERAIIVGLVVAILSIMFRDSIIRATRPFVEITGAVASPADEKALTWIRRNAAPDARILNYPGRYEGQWAPVIAERDAVYVRDQLFYVGADALRQEQETMAEAYLDPNSPMAYDLVRQFGIDYVSVPQLLTRPDLWPTQLRWRTLAWRRQRSWFAEAPYLELVADFDGAQVWRVREIDAWPAQ